MSTITHLPTVRNGKEESMGPTIRRTKAGSEELVTQRLSLSNAQRKILLYANGKRSMEDLTELIPAIADHPDVVTQMRESGLIELIDPELGEVIDGSSSEPAAGPAPGAAAPSSAPAQPAPSAAGGEDLTEVKNQLRPEIERLLGDEGKPALERLNAVSSREELSQLINKLIDLVKLYAGTPASDRFASQFKKWL